MGSCNVHTVVNLIAHLISGLVNGRFMMLPAKKWEKTLLRNNIITVYYKKIGFLLVKAEEQDIITDKN